MHGKLIKGLEERILQKKKKTNKRIINFTVKNTNSFHYKAS